MTTGMRDSLLWRLLATTWDDYERAEGDVIARVFNNGDGSFRAQIVNNLPKSESRGQVEDEEDRLDMFDLMQFLEENEIGVDDGWEKVEQ